MDWEAPKALADLAARPVEVTPLAGAQSKVSLGGAVARRWSPVGQQPLLAEGARSQVAENSYGAVHPGTGEAVAPVVIGWQDSAATLCWLKQLLAACPRGEGVLWGEHAPHPISAEVEEWLGTQPRLRVIPCPADTPEANPQEATWKDLKDEVSPHCWQETKAARSQASDKCSQGARHHTVNFLEKVGYCWREGRIPLLPSPA